MITIRNQYESNSKIDAEATLILLPRSEQLVIMKIAERLHDAIKSQHPRVQFTYGNALEVIAKLGVFLAENGHV